MFFYGYLHEFQKKKKKNLSLISWSIWGRSVTEKETRGQKILCCCPKLSKSSVKFSKCQRQYTLFAGGGGAWRKHSIILIQYGESFYHLKTFHTAYVTRLISCLFDEYGILRSSFPYLNIM